MEPLTRFVASSDGTRIAYDVQGHGPALILLPGRGFPRRTWYEYGYLSRLQNQFTVITLDHRGEGESETPSSPEGHTIDHYLADIHAVADACGMHDFLVWGHSFGATITTHLSAASSRLRAAVMAGSFYGDGFHLFVQKVLTDMQGFAQAKAAGTLSTLPPRIREFAEQTNLDEEIALWHMFNAWPIVEPEEARCPMFMYFGSNNSSLGRVLARRVEVEALGMHLHVFDGLNHLQELTEIDTILPPVLAFLKAQSG
jgi:pimeloyl-ACP methyl ester carboxylesterase